MNLLTALPSCVLPRLQSTLSGSWPWSLFLLLPLGGCLAAAPPPPKVMLSQVQFQFQGSSIQSLQQRRDSGATVALQGQVEQQAPLLGSQAYEVMDASGRIWVVTKNAAPPKGTTVQVKGILRYQAIAVGGQDVGEVYIEEQERVETKTTAAHPDS